ncbi:MAG: hypothetical protein ACOYYJ_02540 [Chloroflexota bacterium]
MESHPFYLETTPIYPGAPPGQTCAASAQVGATGKDKRMKRKKSPIQYVDGGLRS